MLNIRQIENDTKKIYDNSFELSLLQEQLDDMLTEIDKNNIEFEKGKISRTAFKSNEAKLKRSSVRLIKSIKKIISDNIILIGNVEEEVQLQGNRREHKSPKKKVSK